MIQAGRGLLCFWLAAGLVFAPALAGAQPAGSGAEDDLVQLDFNDVELSVVVDTIARLTGQNFIYDDRVRGRVTIVSPTKISVDQAYAVFESVLQVKGFTTVHTPGGAIKVVPIRDAKESNIELLRGRRSTPDSDRFVTRLIPLSYISAEDITNTLKPLVSKDASMVAYGPTNTVILTDAASNIRRMLTILESIDVETYKEELTVIKIRHADATTLAEQLSEIFGAQVSGAQAAPARRARARRAGQAATPVPGADATPGSAVRILTDERTNSLILLTSRQRLPEIREVVKKLDVPVTGGGRIHVHYLKHADAEELAQTLGSLVGGGGGSPGGARGGARGGTPAATQQALRAAITELAEGVTVTADPPTNSLVIQASREGYSTIAGVIEQLDIERPQVLVEALIMEVLITDSQSLGFTGIVNIANPGGPDGSSYVGGSLTNPEGFSGDATNLTDVAQTVLQGIIETSFIGGFSSTAGDTTISTILRASASDDNSNVISAPHILTSDNEEAEIKVGDNIPIITSRVQSAQGNDTGLSSSVNVERQDIGVTLRVTPQISEGDSVRLQIFQEITGVNTTLTSTVAGDGGAEDVGVALSNRKVENTVVASNGETIVIGGLIDDQYEDRIDKVPFLGDVPILGWAFKSTSRSLVKKNLLVFLTPHIVRNPEDLEEQTIRKREEFSDFSQRGLELSQGDKRQADERRRRAEAAGLPPGPFESRNPLRGRLMDHSERYPVERMLEIEKMREARAARSASQARVDAARYHVLAAAFRDEKEATRLMTELIDAGYDGALVSSEARGTLLLELHLGPYESLDQAKVVAETLRESYSLSPTVTVQHDDMEHDEP